MLRLDGEIFKCAEGPVIIKDSGETASRNQTQAFRLAFYLPFSWALSLRSYRQACCRSIILHRRPFDGGRKCWAPGTAMPLN